MKPSLFNTLFFFCLTCLLLTTTHAAAETPPPLATPQQSKEFLDTLRKGTPVQTAVGFYQAGIDCHNRQLNGLTYFEQPHAFLFFTNDSLGNCQLSQVFLSEAKDQLTMGFTCIVSDSEFKEIFAPWFLDALKTFDQTKQPTTMMQKFITTVNKCLKPTNFSTLDSIVQSNIPKSTKPKTNVIP